MYSNLLIFTLCLPLFFRYHTAVKQNHAGNQATNRLDSVKDEMDEASLKVEQCKVSVIEETNAFTLRRF